MMDINIVSRADITMGINELRLIKSGLILLIEGDHLVRQEKDMASNIVSEIASSLSNK